MKVLHRTIADYSTSFWSGGSTTELLIWPAEASYAQRKFLFRLSSATVEAEESIFTRLPGVVRYITPLQGEFSLEHNGCGSTVLHPYEISSFSGDWETVCRGRAVDFNLMLHGCRGTLEHMQGEQDLCTAGNTAVCLFYPHGGTCAQGETLYHLSKGDLLSFFLAEGEQVSLRVCASDLLCARVEL